MGSTLGNALHSGISFHEAFQALRLSKTVEEFDAAVSATILLKDTSARDKTPRERKEGTTSMTERRFNIDNKEAGLGNKPAFSNDSSKYASNGTEPYVLKKGAPGITLTHSRSFTKDLVIESEVRGSAGGIILSSGDASIEISLDEIDDVVQSIHAVIDHMTINK
ncbi:hypothetical protein RPALISO_146 [Ruegeria phage RpAliso]|nr:hypothetical protein RPALISO_146 [Ruegeria phage RpAliso]